MASIYDQVLRQANIREVLQFYGLKIDRNKVLCPFHDDKNPSMSIDDKKQIVKCFSCGAGGNAITFVLKYENEINHSGIAFNDAVTKVVEICNLDIDVSNLKKLSEETKYTANGKKYSEDERTLLEAGSYIQRLWSYNLLTEDGKDGQQYLIDRGVDKKTQESLSVGYSCENQLLSLLNKHPETNEYTLERLGLIRHDSEGNALEVFKNRVMFPIFDERGNVVTFSGRAIHGEEPKYLHTTETDVFHKRDILYNYNNAKNYAYATEMYLVEGYMDVVGGKKMGIENISALMGTALTDEHITMLKRLKCEVTLAEDNDLAGKNAMMSNVPKLLGAGISTNVVDISLLGDYKDFGDASGDNKTVIDVELVKESGLRYLFKNKYFAESKFDVETVYQAFNSVKEDGLLKTTMQEHIFNEYVLENSSLTKDELREVTHPKEIEDIKDPIIQFKNNIMNTFIQENMALYLEEKKDKIMTNYYSQHEEMVRKSVLSFFMENPEKYLSNDRSKLNCALLLYDVLNSDQEYAKFEYLHRFQHENVFDKTYIKSTSGGAKLSLTDEQKQKVISQYESSLSETEKLSLEEVEELYVVNGLTDLDGIFPYSFESTNFNMLKENLKEKMLLSKNKMHFFKYGTLFTKENKAFISDEFKGSTGEFKTILFYNNLGKTLTLTKSNVQKEGDGVEDKVVEEELSQEKLREREVIKEMNSQDYPFTIHNSIFVSEKETDTNYFIRIPNTAMKYYFYLPKDDVSWSNNQQVASSMLSKDKTYKIYDRKGNYAFDWTLGELRYKWEEKKPKQKVNVSKFKEDIKPSEKIRQMKEAKKSESKTIPPLIESNRPKSQDEVIVSKARIIQQSDKGYFIGTDIQDELVFVLNANTRWNHEKTHLSIKATKGMLKTSGLSRYKMIDGVMSFDKKIGYKELSSYFKVRGGQKSVERTDMGKEEVF